MDGCIDFVIPWVDGSDPVWQAKKAKYTGEEYADGNTEARFRDWDTLKYWFRGVEQFAPWVRYIWFITDDQKPDWLNVDHPKIKWVKHSDFIPKECLPTFSANPIEWNLHRIDGLSEQFVYFNDDMFLIRETKPKDFFVNGLPCDQPHLGMIYPDGFFAYMVFNNIQLLNRYFSLKDSIRKDWKKWIRHQSPKDLLKLVWYGRRDLIPGFIDTHIHKSYLKRTFSELWEKENEWIHETCTHRQRTKEDLTSWCVHDWQIMTGQFHPKKPIGKAFSTQDIETKARAYMYGRKGKVICLNDNENEKDFQKHREMILTFFEELLPEKSSFEY